LILPLRNSKTLNATTGKKGKKEEKERDLHLARPIVSASFFFPVEKGSLHISFPRTEWPDREG